MHFLAGMRCVDGPHKCAAVLQVQLQRTALIDQQVARQYLGDGIEHELPTVLRRCPPVAIAGYPGQDAAGERKRCPL